MLNLFFREKQLLEMQFITAAWYGLSGQQRKDQLLDSDLFRIQTDKKGIVNPVFEA